MRLLILGGTVFLGRHLVRAAQLRGHEVTLFNRGQHHPELFPEVTQLRGDRDGDLRALEDGRWDAAIDTSGYVPRLVGASARLLASRVEHYTFVSSISALAGFSVGGQDETAVVGRLEDETSEAITGETYGPLKALSEQAAEAAMPGRVLVVRPGLIVGPHDPTDRFPYWVRRIAQGGEVLAPGEASQPVQLIDGRDLARWMVTMIERGATGVYHATGPASPLTLGEVLAACQATSGTDASFTWVDEMFLLEQGVQPWTELPLWIPASDAFAEGFMRINVGKALGAGLRFRPLAGTIRDTLAWDRERPSDFNYRAGMEREKEVALLAAWHQRYS